MLVRERGYVPSLSLSSFLGSPRLPLFVGELGALRKREAVRDLFVPHYVLENHVEPFDFLEFGGCCHTTACEHMGATSINGMS